MAVGPQEIAALMGKGYGFVCATCRHLHEAQTRGLSGCMVLHRGGDCKGPFSGGAFQAYDGPILRNRLHALCFVCGSDSDAGIEIVSGQTRVIVGICDKHLPLLESMSAGDSRPPFVTKVRAKVLDQ